MNCLEDRSCLVSRLAKLFCAHHARRGGGLRSRSASCLGSANIAQNVQHAWQIVPKNDIRRISTSRDALMVMWKLWRIALVSKVILFANIHPTSQNWKQMPQTNVPLDATKDIAWSMQCPSYNMKDEHGNRGNPLPLFNVRIYFLSLARPTPVFSYHFYDGDNCRGSI